jgi:hypothetical protein
MTVTRSHERRSHIVSQQGEACHMRSIIDRVRSRRAPPEGGATLFSSLIEITLAFSGQIILFLGQAREHC